LLLTVAADGTASDVTLANEVPSQSYQPFGATADVGAALLLGFRSALPFTREELGLQIYLAARGQALLAPAVDAMCGPETVANNAPQLAWEWWDGVSWEELDVTGDETRNMTQSGQAYVKVPGQIPAVPARAMLSGPTFAPPTLDDIVALTDAERGVLRASTSTDTVSELALLKPDDLRALLSIPDDAAGKARAKAIIDDAKRLSKPPELYYWLRVRLAAGSYAEAPAVDRIQTNTVQATAALSVFDEAVGSSDGTPNQIFTLRRSPLLSSPPLVLEVDEGNGPQPWSEVTDFFQSTESDTHYVLNLATGTVRFGDGRRGRIPVAGQFNIIARQYRYGGGLQTNVGANTITELATPIAEVESVTNYRSAEGGQSEEILSDTLLRAAREMKANERAVALDDFAMLAKRTPGALVARSAAYVTVGGDGTRLINVVIVPQSKETKPVPAEAAIQRVCRYLDERRLITTQLRVAGPTYHDIDVVLDLRATDDADLRTVKNAVEQRLRDYLHPLRGGTDSQGWPFGRNVFYSELLREIMVQPGVLRVEDLTLRKLLARYDDQATAQANLNAAIAAEQAAFGLSAGDLSGEVVAVVEPGETPGTMVRHYYIAAVYSCHDMPVADGALLALRDVSISISYERRRGAL
jgi:predicted phage baseplate assembly protein